MSRAYKKMLLDETDDLSTGTLNALGVEKLSGADLEQVRLAALQRSGNPAVDAAGTKTLGNSIPASVLATVTADGVNTITVDTIKSLFVGQSISVRVVSTGAARFATRNITAINPVTRVVTYDGADSSATIVATDVVTPGAGLVPNTRLTGSDLERFAGE